MTLPLYLRCEAGDIYGLGHAMRLRAIARELRQLAPEMALAVVGSTEELRTVFNDEPNVSLHMRASAEEAARYPYDGPVLVDLPFGCLEDRFRWTRQLVIRMDAPWASPAMCDAVILPGVHHERRIEKSLVRVFGRNAVLSRSDALILNEALPSCVSREQRTIPLMLAAGGSDPGGLGAQWHDMLTMPSESFALDRLPFVQLCVCAWGITAYECAALRVPTIVVARDTATYAEATHAQRDPRMTILHTLLWSSANTRRLFADIVSSALLALGTEPYAGFFMQRHDKPLRNNAYKVAQFILAHVRERYGETPSTTSSARSNKAGSSEGIFMNRTVMSYGSAVEAVAQWMFTHDGRAPKLDECVKMNGLPHRVTLQYVCGGVQNAVSAARALLSGITSYASIASFGTHSAALTRQCLRCEKRSIPRSAGRHMCYWCRNAVEEQAMDEYTFGALRAAVQQFEHEAWR